MSARIFALCCLVLAVTPAPAAANESLPGGGLLDAAAVWVEMAAVATSAETPTDGVGVFSGLPSANLLRQVGPSALSEDAASVDTTGVDPSPALAHKALDVLAATPNASTLPVMSKRHRLLVWQAHLAEAAERERVRAAGEAPHFVPPVPAPAGSGFGERLHPVLDEVHFHYGVDYSAEIGDPVYAAASGVMSRLFETDGYGLAVEVDHGEGWKTVYAHLSAYVAELGDHVRAGDVVAAAGNSGLSTGPHVHFEVYRFGTAVDPEPLMVDGVR